MYALGVMVGSSLDGQDVCLSKWWWDGKWHFSIVKAATFELDPTFIRCILSRNFERYDVETFHRGNLAFTTEMAERLVDFLRGQPRPHVVGVHGPTVYHNETVPYSIQLGEGDLLYARLKVPVVVNFRQLDQALGGPGAPILPYVEKLVFPDYDAFLNLGGIANVDCWLDGRLHAVDVVPCNQLLNRLAFLQGKPYDEDGKMARQGQVIPSLLERLRMIQRDWPAVSMDRREIEAVFWPLLKEENAPVEDKLRTVVEWVALAVADHLEAYDRDCNVMITGGGAHNQLLVERIQDVVPTAVTLPDALLIDYKEALLFGLMALLRFYGLPNTELAAHHGLTAGALYGAGPPQPLF